MPLRLIPPGIRKGNPFFLCRGTVDGRDFEVSTKTRDKAAARRFAKEFEREILARRIPRPGEAITYGRVTDLYTDFRDPSKADRERHERLKAILGTRYVVEIRQVDLVAAADILQPGKSPATRNREVLTPAATVIHYAAENGYCEWLRVRLFKEPAPATRAVSMDVAGALIAAAPEGPKRLFLLWLFREGTRISQTLGIRWDDIDWSQQTFRLYDKKAQAWQTFQLHPEVFEELTTIPVTERTGRLWPWTQKTGVYRWLRPLARDGLGIVFTPHMARHSLGTWLNQSGAGLRTIMSALGHKDPKSSIRYQAADVEMVRTASEKLGDLPGNRSVTRRKAML
jgi:integrase